MDSCLSPAQCACKHAWQGQGMVMVSWGNILPDLDSLRCNLLVYNELKHNVRQVFYWIKVRQAWGPDINCVLLQELHSYSRYMRPGNVVQQRTSVVGLLILVFSGKCQSGSVVWAVSTVPTRGRWVLRSPSWSLWLFSERPSHQGPAGGPFIRVWQCLSCYSLHKGTDTDGIRTLYSTAHLWVTASQKWLKKNNNP